MNKAFDAFKRHYDDFNDEGVSLMIATVCLFIAGMVLLSTSIDPKSEWSDVAVNIAGGFIILGMLIWFGDLLINLIYHAVRWTIGLCKKAKIHFSSDMGA